MLQKNLTVNWIVLYGTLVSTPYGIDEGTIATYVFISPTNYDKQTIKLRRKELLTEQGISIQNPRFVFDGKYNRKLGKMINSYK